MTPPRLVYIVDDWADYRFLVKQVFNLFLGQYQLRLFADGADLVADLDSLSESADTLPRVIALDIDMPGLDGFQTLVRLKQHPLWQSVPVVMISNRNDPDYQQQSYRLGASAFMLKPMGMMGVKSLLTLLCEYEGDFRLLSDLYVAGN